MEKNALLSVYSKAGITQFASELVALGWRIFSSGGTATALQKAGIPVTDVAELSGLSPILDHRVATLVPHIHGGLLAAERHLEELQQLGYPWIDLVCVDFYPLEEETHRPDATRESVIEKTDIGGPTLCRSGAKGRRIVVIDPADRMRVIEWLKNDELDGVEFRNSLAAKAEATVAAYCLESARFHSDGEYEGFIGKRIATCKYGENAWQNPAYLYTTDSDDPLALDKFEVIEGTAPSYNNWIDIDRLLQTVTHIINGYGDNTVSVAVSVKHGNPCGAAVSHCNDKTRALEKMMAGDPLAIFGGLVMANFALDESLCSVFAGKLLDGIIAPSFTPRAVEMMRRKNGKCRLIVNPALKDLAEGLDQVPKFRQVRGGFLMQPNYTFVPFGNGCITEYGTATTEQELDMILAWAIGSTSNSNTITLVKNNQLIGSGVGQQDRVGAAELAIRRAQRSGHEVAGAVAYSDSFFPFPDGPQTLIDAGVNAIFTSSGSVNDKDTIDACERAGVALYMVPDAEGRGFFGH